MALDLVEFFNSTEFVHYIQIPLNKVFMSDVADEISLIAFLDEKNAWQKKTKIDLVWIFFKWIFF